MMIRRYVRVLESRENLDLTGADYIAASAYVLRELERAEVCIVMQVGEPILVPTTTFNAELFERRSDGARRDQASPLTSGK